MPWKVTNTFIGYPGSDGKMVELYEPIPVMPDREAQFPDVPERVIWDDPRLRPRVREVADEIGLFAIAPVTPDTLI